MNPKQILRQYFAPVVLAIAFFFIYQAFWRGFNPEIVWVLAFAIFGVGDPVSTVIGVSQENVEEGMWFARRFFGAEPGLIPMLVAHFAFLIPIYAFTRIFEPRYLGAVGFSMLIYGLYAVTGNSLVYLRSHQD